jgi:hypothetical protein
MSTIASHDFAIVFNDLLVPELVAYLVHSGVPHAEDILHVIERAHTTNPTIDHIMDALHPYCTDGEFTLSHLSTVIFELCSTDDTVWFVAASFARLAPTLAKRPIYTVSPTTLGARLLQIGEEEYEVLFPVLGEFTQRVIKTEKFAHRLYIQLQESMSQVDTGCFDRETHAMHLVTACRVLTAHAADRDTLTAYAGKCMLEELCKVHVFS